MRNRRKAVAERYNLALLCKPDSPIEAARRLRKNCAPSSTSAPANRAAPTMEQPQIDSGLIARRRKPRLSILERPVGRQIASILARIRVPQHDLLESAASGQVAGVRTVRIKLPHQAVAPLKVLDRLEQRDHVDIAL